MPANETRARGPSVQELKRRRSLRRQRLLLFASIVVIALIWNQFFYHPTIVGQTAWERTTKAGLEALDVGDLKKADKFFKESLEQATSYGAEDYRVGTSLQNLASLRVEQRRYDEAVACWSTAMQS